MTIILRRLALLASVWYLLALALLVCLRVRYPFELEWLEGASVDHVRTVLAGRPLYARPSLEFIPLTYTPGYFYLAAGLSKILGVGFLPLRLISVLSTAGLLALTCRLVWRETGDVQAGILAAGLFAATFGWTAGWLDLARTDSLFLLLTMLAVYILRWHDSTPAMIAAGVLISLAFLTKQTALIIAIPVSVWCVLRSWRAFLAFAATVALIVGGTGIAFERLFHGWYSYYVFAVPAQHPIQLQSVLGFWRHDVVVPLPVALAVSAAYLTWTLVSGDRHRALFYTFVGAGFFAGAWVSRLHSLSFINVVLPAYLITAVTFAIAVHETIRRFGGSDASGPTGLVGPALYALCLVQLVRLVYWPAALVPSAQDVAAGRLLVQQVARTPGNVFLPYHGYLPALAGKNTSAHAAVLADVIRGGRTPIEMRLAEELTDALRSHRFDAIIMPDSPTPIREWLPVEQYYQPDERVVTVHSRFWRPETRYVPR